jgi:YidC/Oxa1 family membrane protein insertase
VKSEDQKNFILFIVIAAVLLIGSQFVSAWLFPQNPPSAKVEKGKVEALPNPGADPAADSAKANLNRAQVLAASRGERVVIETPAFTGSINLRGARIDDLALNRYKETVAKNSPQIRLLSPQGVEGSYFAEFGWTGDGVQAPTRDTLWKASSPKLTPTTPVTLVSTNAKGQQFRIELAVDKDFMFTVRQTVANIGDAPIAVRPYAFVTRAKKSTDLDQWTANVGPMVVTNGVADYLNYSDVDTEEKKFDTVGGWAGYTDHYWLTALVPNQGSKVAIRQKATATKAYQAEYQLTDPLTVRPGRQVTYSSHFFAGAKEVKLLDEYEANLGIQKFGYAIDWGWFGLIEQPIFYYLDWLWKLVGNFGIAIILLTITIRGLLFPIAQKQFASMANMRAIQPKMKALQERYKDDKTKQQQEVMKLYKEEKVNPLAGCLPLLLQIPIMFALYKVLLLTIEMRHQPFALWVHDLSAPDPATILNLFGYLPFTVPSFLAIGVFPLLLGISMYFQMKLNPAPMDEMQKQVFAIMPWMLMFVMAPFAVGLQLYWITSNCITILQQRWLYSKHPALKEPVKKDPPKEVTAK